MFGQDQRNYQKGAVRTNCLDCLDRTNIVQAEIACSTVRTILDAIKKNEIDQGSKFHPQSGFGGSQEYQFINEALKQLWNTNGDKLSNQYAGTDSNMSGVVENGK